MFLHGSEVFNCNVNKKILKAAIKFLKKSERFNSSPYYKMPPLL